MHDDAISDNVWRLMSNEQKMHRIALKSAMAYGFGVEDLKGKSRMHELSKARHVAMWICSCKDIIDATSVDIGKFFGGRSHSMVIHGCKRTKEILERGGAKADSIISIKNTLKEAPINPGWSGCVSRKDKVIVSIAHSEEEFDYQNVERLRKQTQFEGKSTDAVIDKLLKVIKNITQ